LAEVVGERGVAVGRAREGFQGLADAGDLRLGVAARPVASAACRKASNSCRGCAGSGGRARETII
jgi:hypothetical protein